MYKSTLIFAFLMLCTSNTVFGQFHTITQQSKLYTIEQVPNPSDAGNNHNISATNADNATNRIHPVKRIDDKAPTPPRLHSDSDSLRQQYINKYLSVSFPLKQLIINSPFGQRKDPITGKKRNHNGLDLRASSDEVYAMLDGTVVKAGEDKRSGKYITIQYGEFLVSYCHLSRIWIKQGMQVKPGEIVGITGSTGRSTGPHLHITCKQNGKNVDPLLLFDYIKATQEECVVALTQL